MAAPVGTLVSGRYRLDAVVGTGGMSTVYRAFDTLLERQVAIKMMHREIARDAQQLERFRREARSVAQLNHPYVVGVIDAGDDGGAGGTTSPTPYIVFEYIEGETLKARIRRNGRLETAEAVAYAIEIARALSGAHAASIVHRDVKPQNVLIDEEGTAKVTDFGIARSLVQDGLTADGRVLGTTDYVSPEQALGHAVTGQSDIYSLGIVLFEMLTGDVPFHGENQVTVAMRHVREELPDLQLRRPGMSSALAAVVDRATEKDLSRRYATADQMIADLEDALAIETSRSGHTGAEATAVLRTLPAQSRKRLPLRNRIPRAVAVLALLVAAGAVAAVLLLAADKTQRGTGPSATPPKVSGVESVSLGRRSAHDYDPYGKDGEHPEQTSFAVDLDPGTAWSTEDYRSGFQPPKIGVGLYIDAKPSVEATRMSIQTPTTHWQGAVYAATAAVPSTLPAAGWKKVGTIPDAEAKTTVRLGTGGNTYRYYLVWITKLPSGGAVKLSEVSLFQPKR